VPSASTILKKAEGFVSRSVGDDTIVVPVRAGVANLEAIFTLNGVGSAIWSGIDGRATVAELSRAVAAVYDVGADAASADVVEFVELLLRKGLVVPVTAEGHT
jgi:hypothetical protein